MRAAGFLLLGALLVGLGCAPEPAPAREAGIKAKAPDLDALAAMRSGSEGAKLESELAETRSANATKAYANREGEPTLLETDGGGGGAAPGSFRFDPIADADAGSSAPSDLDTLDPEVDSGPWINMRIVEERIRARDRSLRACWQNDGPGGNGRVDLRVTIGAGGRATSITLAPSSSVRLPALSDCLGRTLRNVSYPEPRNGSVTFDYPVKF